MPCVKVAAFCSFLRILDCFFLVHLKAHLAKFVEDSKLVLRLWTAKISRLAKEVNALALIHRQSKVPIAMIQCHIAQSNWIL